MVGVGCPVARQLTLMAFSVSRGITATSPVIIGFPKERLHVYYLAVRGLTDQGYLQIKSHVKKNVPLTLTCTVFCLLNSGSSVATTSQTYVPAVASEALCNLSTWPSSSRTLSCIQSHTSQSTTMTDSETAQIYIQIQMSSCLSLKINQAFYIRSCSFCSCFSPYFK